MRVLQVVTNLNFGDAIGNHARGLNQILKQAGYEAQIFANKIHPRLPANSGRNISELPKLRNNDVLIYHMCNGSPLNLRLKNWDCRKVLMYHNITPPDMVQPFDSRIAQILRSGIEDTHIVKDYVDSCIAMSQYNKQDLIIMGYQPDKIWVMPGYLIPFSDYKQAPDMNFLKKYSDGKINILFVGRVAPNKRQEDIIRSFGYYHQHINSNSRLLLVGSAFSDSYLSSLKKYVEELDILNSIEFLGHLSFPEIIACYKAADIFLCMSEHEGFCVPLVEAMYFGVPIIAFSSSAIPDTLAGCGILIKKKDPILIGMFIDRLVKDFKFRNHIIKKQNERLKDFSPLKLSDRFLTYIENF